MAGQPTPYLGSRISLISKSEIRYEGILYTVDTNESTIALANVKSFGTENRPTDRPVAARDDIYEFIIFKATDIKDLSVCETPQPVPQLPGGLPYDPAIVQVSQGTAHDMRSQNAGSRSVTPSFSQPLSPGGDPVGGMSNIAGMDQNRAPGAGRPISRQVGGIGRGSGMGISTGGSGMSGGGHAGGYGSPLDTSGDRSVGQHQGLVAFSQSTRDAPQHGSAGFGSMEYRRTNAQRENTAAPRYQGLNKYPSRNGIGGGYPSAPGPRLGGNRGAFSRSGDSYSSDRGDRGEREDDGYRSYSQALRRGHGEGGFGRGGRGGRGFGREDDRYSGGMSGGGYRGGGGRGIYDNGGMRIGGTGYRYGGGGMSGGWGGGGGGYRGGTSYYRGGVRGGVTLKIPSEDFDFEQSQKKFEETLKETGEEVDKLKISNGDLDAATEERKHDGDSGNETQGNDTEGSGEEAATFYNKDSSFFDNISCEATEKEEGLAERKAGGMNRRHERQLNTETFGQSSIHRGYRGGYRRNMGMRWGRGGRGGGYGGGYRDDGGFPTRIRSS